MKKFVIAIIIWNVVMFSCIASGGTERSLIQLLQIIILGIYTLLASLASFNVKDIGQAFYDAFSKGIEKDKQKVYERDIEILNGIQKLITYFAFAIFLMFLVLISELDASTITILHSVAISAIILFYAYLIKLLFLLPMENTLKVKFIKSREDKRSEVRGESI